MPVAVLYQPEQYCGNAGVLGLAVARARYHWRQAMQVGVKVTGQRVTASPRAVCVSDRRPLGIRNPDRIILRGGDTMPLGIFRFLPPARQALDKFSWRRPSG